MSQPAVNAPIDSAGLGARRGAQVLQRLRDNPPNIWYGGELVRDVTTHPALRGGVRTLADLYDLQWKHADTTLFDSPSSGRKVARSFMLPRTHEELRSISVAMKIWEDHTHGMMGRVPDYINRAMSGYAAGAPFLGEADPRFGANAVRYHEVSARARSLSHSYADSAPGEPGGELGKAGRSLPRCAGQGRNIRGDRHSRLPYAGDAADFR